MKKYLITPNQHYVAGHAQSVLGTIGSGPLMARPDGSIIVMLTDQQYQMFTIRGSAHKIQLVPEGEAEPAPAPPPPLPIPNTASGAAPVPPPPGFFSTGPASVSAYAGPANTIFVPTVEEVVASGYSREVAELIVKRQTRIAQGLPPEEEKPGNVQAIDAPLPGSQPDGGPPNLTEEPIPPAA